MRLEKFEIPFSLSPAAGGHATVLVEAYAWSRADALRRCLQKLKAQGWTDAEMEPFLDSDKEVAP